MVEQQTAWQGLIQKYGGQGKPPEGTPHGWIQWKGTDLCMDLRCVCGDLTHLDSCSFAYLVQCRNCGRIYWPNAHISMTELTGEDRDAAIRTEFVKVTSG